MGMAVIVMEMANRDLTGKAQFPGDFRNGLLDFGWDDQSEDWQMRKRTIEINNGRAAMMGILGIMVHESLGNLNEILPAGAAPPTILQTKVVCGSISIKSIFDCTSKAAFDNPSVIEARRVN